MATSDRIDLLPEGAERVLETAQRDLEGTNSFLAIVDPQGVVRYGWSSTDPLRRHLERADVQRGAGLDAGLHGLNAAGMAIERRAPAVVRGPSHSNERWHDLVCAAAPIIDPGSRRLLGALNVTCLDGEPSPHLTMAIRLVHRNLDDLLRRQVQLRHRRLLDAHLAVCAASSSAVVTLDGSTMIAESGFDQFPLERERLWGLVRQAGSSARELVLPGGVRAAVAPVRPGSLDEGCSLVVDAADVVRIAGGVAPADAGLSPLERAEKEVIASALREHEGNKREAAAWLRISRGTLYERIRRYGLETA